jgi:cyclophilin family peptidyl-prolyl cis-trans isomerase
MKALIFILTILCSALSNHAATIATFSIPRVGVIEIELFDDKPVTVSNFLKYASSGRFENQIIHRWVPGFVIQGGGHRVDTSNPQQWQLVPVVRYPAITNETQVGTFRSNVYGTIAMARAGSDTNSATSEWFINLADNGKPASEGGNDLDSASGGYAVFGKVISNITLLDRFVPPPPSQGIYINQDLIFSFPPTPTPVLSTNELTWNDLVYVDLAFRRDMNLQSIRNIRGARQIAWDSVAGVTHAIDHSSNLVNWVEHSTVVGTGLPMQITDTSDDPKRFYRVRLVY